MKLDVEGYYDRKPRKELGRTAFDRHTESFVRCEETLVALLRTLHQLPRRMAHCATQPRNTRNVGASTDRNR